MFKSLAVFAARVTPQFIKNTVHRSRLLDRISRLVFSTLVAADGTTAVINSGPSQGIKLAVGPHTSHAHLSGTYEIECQTAIARNVRPSTVCYDLGASIGYMSLLMARTAKHVYAFEPAPHAIEQLRLQLAANNFDNVTIVTNPVSNSVREVDFSLTETAYGSRIGNGDTKWRTIKLQTITLDEFTTTNPMPDFMKIDVEDEEGQVLEGAKSILRRGTTVILCELHSQRSQETALDLLGRFGYRFRGLDGGPFRALAPGDRGETWVLALPGTI